MLKGCVEVAVTQIESVVTQAGRVVTQAPDKPTCAGHGVAGTLPCDELLSTSSHFHVAAKGTLLRPDVREV